MTPDGIVSPLNELEDCDADLWLGLELAPFDVLLGQSV